MCGNPVYHDSKWPLKKSGIRHKLVQSFLAICREPINADGDRLLQSSGHVDSSLVKRPRKEYAPKCVLEIDFLRGRIINSKKMGKDTFRNQLCGRICDGAGNIL